MTLTPVAPPKRQFNQAAADRVYNSLMKLEEDEVRALTTMVVVDVMNETIEKNLSILQQHLNEVVDTRIGRAKQAVAYKLQKDGHSPELEEMAKQLVEISKANQYDFGYKFSEADVRRDSSGKFATHIVGTNRRKPVKGIKVPEYESNGKKVKLTAAQRARYQNEYQQVSSFLRGAQDSGIDLSDDTVRVRLQNAKTGEVYTAAMETRGGRPEPKLSQWDPRYEHVIGIEARPSTLTAGGAAFNLIGALGQPATGASVGAGVKAAGEGARQFSDDWYERDEMNENSLLYNRLASGGKYVGSIAPAGSKTQMAAAFANYVGDHGPEAEKVFGPPTRRAMYRYRGIQRKVNEEEISEATGKEVAEGANYASRWNRYSSYLSGRVPTRQLSDLNMKAGHTPPSEGVILDKNGKATVQAVGYGDDHYLPFNLKQLKGLRGGEYIRTRAQGGLTSEDVYTGLMSGAKAVTVVSRSGTFRVEFEEDFKGTRRYNQKAARMVGRYQRLLDAVRSREVERIPLDAAKRRAIENEVREQYANLPESELSLRVQNRIAEVSNNAKLSPEEETEYQAWAIGYDEENKDKRVSQRAHEKAIKYNSMLEEHQLNYQLNGRGYEAAQQALREQFPYYIKSTKFSPRSSDDDFFELGTDKGFVRAGALRPVRARGNFFGGSRPEANQAFASAERTNYGNLNLKFGRAQAARPDVAQPEQAEVGSTPIEPVGSPVEQARAHIAERRAADEFADELISLRPELAKHLAEDNAAPWLHSMDESQLREYVRLGENRQQILDYLNAGSWEGGRATLEQRIPGLRTTMARLKTLSGARGGGKFNRNDVMLVPDTPYSFEGEDFQPGLPADRYMSAIHALDKGQSFTGGDNPLSAMSETELRQELETARQYSEIVDEAIAAGKNGASAADQADIVNDQGMNLNRFKVVSESLREQKNKIPDYMEDVHKIRALRAASNAPVVPPKAPDELGKSLGLATTLQELLSSL